MAVCLCCTVYRADVKDIPNTLCETPDGTWLVGLETSLWIYELGKNHLLLKTELKKSLHTYAVQMRLMGNMAPPRSRDFSWHNKCIEYCTINSRHSFHGLIP